MNPKSCNAFASGTPDPTRCKVKGCGRRLADHDKEVRQAWFRGASDLILLAVNVRNEYLNQSNPKPCIIWHPKQYFDVTLCDCGRLESEHNLTAIARGKTIIRKEQLVLEKTGIPAKCQSIHNLGGSIDVVCDLPSNHLQSTPVHEHVGSRGRWAWTSAHAIRFDTHPCKRFDPIFELPGRCKWCGCKYIDHEIEAQGTVVEDYQDFHSPTCVSVVKVGNNRCSCLIDKVKQQMLDQMSLRGSDVTKPERTKPVLVEGIVVMPTKTACSSFNTVDLTEWNCDSCGQRFYNHSVEHREGFDSWTDWRCAHMTNEDVIQWFMDLGIDDTSRAKAFRQRLDHYDFLDKTWPPSEKLVKELYSMLPGKLRILVDGFKSNIESKSDLTSEERDTCFNCGCPLVKPREVSMCVDCVKLATMDGPAKRFDPPFDTSRMVDEGGVVIKPFD